jgi:hypothetical protein
MAVAIKPGAAAEAGIPRELFRVPRHVDPIRRQYAVTADGQNFVIMENTGDVASHLTVLLNWNAHLKRYRQTNLDPTYRYYAGQIVTHLVTMTKDLNRPCPFLKIAVQNALARATRRRVGTSGLSYFNKYVDDIR